MNILDDKTPHEKKSVCNKFKIPNRQAISPLRWWITQIENILLRASIETLQNQILLPKFFAQVCQIRSTTVVDFEQ